MEGRGDGLRAGVLLGTPAGGLGQRREGGRGSSRGEHNGRRGLLCLGDVTQQRAGESLGA